jgi:branched-chain amino acid transport system substrate-binding protein
MSIMIATAVMIVACGADTPVEERAKHARKAKGDVVIGVGLPLADQTILFKQGIEMAVAEINGGKGVLGRKIRIVWGDDKGSLKDGFLVAKNFVDNPEMVAVIGHIQDYISYTNASLYDYSGMLMFAPLATQRGFAGGKFTRVFRNIPDGDGFADALNRFMKDRGFRKMLVYGSDQEENLAEAGSLADILEFAAEKNGIATSDRQVYDMYSGGYQFAKVLKRWQTNYAFDAIFFGGARARVDQGLEFIKTARDMGINVPVISGMGLDHDNFTGPAGRYANNVFAASMIDWNAPGAELKAFMEGFRKRYGKNPDIEAAQAYEALQILAAAMNRAGTIVPDEVAGILRKEKDWPGLTGKYGFDAGGGIIGKPVLIKALGR